eukprot:TRINITY_DN22572_c0_g1_i2.p1 TRINITY_DN22572_c0_g1~~TRINITY_DN22572_c0_g1_i2.p1  ORF type:complete len:409 (+),score=79.92 TRINITY_DN22572_c0_g1_i2:59-1285(+)
MWCSAQQLVTPNCLRPQWLLLSTSCLAVLLGCPVAALPESSCSDAEQSSAAGSSFPEQPAVPASALVQLASSRGSTGTAQDFKQALRNFVQKADALPVLCYVAVALPVACAALVAASFTSSQAEQERRNELEAEPDGSPAQRTEHASGPLGMHNTPPTPPLLKRLMMPDSSSSPQKARSTSPVPQVNFSPSSPRQRTPRSPRKSARKVHQSWCQGSTACPALVVLAGSESVVAMRLPTDSQVNKTMLDIVDMNGVPVLMAEVTRASPAAPGRGSQEQQPSVALMRLSPGVGGNLCMGQAAENPQGGPAVDVCTSEGDLFGKLSWVESEDVGHFVLRVGREEKTKMLFQGNFVGHRIQVLDDEKRLLAHCEPCAVAKHPGVQFMRITVKPQVDAGVILVCFAAIVEQLA